MASPSSTHVLSMSLAAFFIHHFGTATVDGFIATVGTTVKLSGNARLFLVSLLQEILYLTLLDTETWKEPVAVVLDGS